MSTAAGLMGFAIVLSLTGISFALSRIAKAIEER